MALLKVLLIRKNADKRYMLSAQRSLQSILSELRKCIGLVNVRELWIVHEGGSSSKKYYDDVDIYNAFSFSDGTELLSVLRPDLVIVTNDHEYLQRSILNAAVSIGIPTVDLLSSSFGLINTDVDSKRKVTFGGLRLLEAHPRSIGRRYFFLLKTLFRANYGISYIIGTIVKDFYLPFISATSRFSFGGGDLNIVSTPKWATMLEQNGIDRNKIVVTGDISMDTIHSKLANMTVNPARNMMEKKEILFITLPMVEHGLWTSNMRKKIVTSVVTAIREHFRNEANLRIKIHPTSESIDTYKQILDPIDRSLEIIQDTDLFSVCNESDIIISFGHGSSSLLEPLFLGKPLFIINFFNEDMSYNIYINDNVAIECRNIDELIENIKTCTKPRMDPNILHKFIEKHIYLFDGNCSKRAAESIVTFLGDRLNIPRSPDN